MQLTHPSSFLLFLLSLGELRGDVFQSFTGSLWEERGPQFPEEEARLATSSSWSLSITAGAENKRKRQKMSKIIINVLKTDATRVWNSIDTALNLHIYFIILSLWVMLRLDRTCSDMQTWGRSKYILNIYTIAFKINYFCSARMYYWFKVTKDFYIVTDAVLLNFIFKESWKISITVSTKISSCTIVFNINNNKKCHEHQIRI